MPESCNDFVSSEVMRYNICKSGQSAQEEVTGTGRPEALCSGYDITNVYRIRTDELCIHERRHFSLKKDVDNILIFMFTSIRDTQ